MCLLGILLLQRNIMQRRLLRLPWPSGARQPGTWGKLWLLPQCQTAPCQWQRTWEALVQAHQRLAASKLPSPPRHPPTTHHHPHHHHHPTAPRTAPRTSGASARWPSCLQTRVGGWWHVGRGAGGCRAHVSRRPGEGWQPDAGARPRRLPRRSLCARPAAHVAACPHTHVLVHTYMHTHAHTSWPASCQAPSP